MYNLPLRMEVLPGRHDVLGPRIDRDVVGGNSIVRFGLQVVYNP